MKRLSLQLLWALLSALLLHAAARARANDHEVLGVGSGVEGDTPLEALWTIGGEELLVLHERSRNLVFLEGDTLVPLATVAFDDKPSDVALTPDGTRALVALIDVNRLVVVDLATRTEIADIALGTERPYAVEVTADSSRAVVAGYGATYLSSGISVVDLSSYAETLAFAAPGQFSLEEQTSDGRAREHPEFALSSDGATAYVAANWLLHGYSLATGANVGVFAPPDFMQATVWARRVPGSDDLLAMVWEAGFTYELYLVDSTTFVGQPIGLRFLDTVRTPDPNAVAITPDGARVFVSGYELRAVDLTGFTVSAGPILEGESLAVSSDGATVVVAGWPYAAGAARAYDGATLAPWSGADARTGPGRQVAARPGTSDFAVLATWTDEDVARVTARGGKLELAAKRLTGPGTEGDRPVALGVGKHGLVAANAFSDNVVLLDPRLPSATRWVDVADRPGDVRLFRGGETALVWCAGGVLDVVDVPLGLRVDRLALDVSAWSPFSSTPTARWIVPVDGTHALLYGDSRLAFVEVGPGQVTLLGTAEDPGWSEARGGPAVTSNGAAVLPRYDEERIELVDLATMTSLGTTPTFDHPHTLVTDDTGDLWVAEKFALERFDVSGAPKSLGAVYVQLPGALAVDGSGGHAYVVSGFQKRISIVASATMTVVHEVQLGTPIVDLLVTPPFLDVLLDDGRLQRYRADGPNTVLLSEHPIRPGATRLTVGGDGRDVFVLGTERDEVDVFRF